ANGEHGRTKLTFERMEKAADGTHDFLFRQDAPLRFRPGQALDCTLALRGYDARGNRRTFTIASAPSEPQLRLGIRQPASPSLYKRALVDLTPGDTLFVQAAAGRFTLPETPDARFVFLAGGIGITPFRSMIAEMLATQDRRSVALFYANRRPEEAAYGDLLALAQDKINLQVFHCLSAANVDGGLGRLTARQVLRSLPSAHEALFYISGSPGFVRALRRGLIRQGIQRRRIRTDAFSGLGG
ncbi:FAD-dependent oxidoreductase, partial [Thioclava sp. BHET1]